MGLFHTSYDSTEKLYKEHLTTINGIKFGFREIDVIACIIHNRGEKKIASILSVQPRTVSVHVQNIMNKIQGSNSKDTIIDFLEHSEKYATIKEYYSHLLVRANFEKQLKKIGYLLSKMQITFHCKKEEWSEDDEIVMRYLKKHLEFACILSQKDNNTTSGEELSLLTLKRKVKDDYYVNFLEAVCDLLKLDQLSEIISEFKIFYENFITGNKPLVEIPDKRSNYFTFRTKSSLIVTLSVAVFIILSIIFLANDKWIKQQSSSQVVFTTPNIIIDLEDFLKILHTTGFNANNVNSEQLDKNQRLIKKVEKILDFKNIKDVENYFNKAEMDTSFLLSYAYSLHALASYYMYNNHDGKKAKEILLYTKNLIENYINSRSKIKVNFDHLLKEEVLTELSVVKNLPQIYTRLIYSLGRTYFYNGKIEDGKKYFEISKYLGLKLGLLEGYLSDASGLLIIRKEEIEEKIKNFNTTGLKEQILSLIDDINIIKQDDKAYISDFNPNASKQVTKIPSNETYNIFFCDLKIIESYKDLIQIDRKANIAPYLSLIAKILVGEEKDNIFTSTGLIQIMDKVQLKKLASLYICLGDIMLLLVQNDTPCSNHFIRIISVLLQSDTSVTEYQSLTQQNLYFAEMLFNKAKSISRNTDFTKADAYDGLVRVLQEKLLDPAIGDEEKNTYLRKINDLIQKKDEINIQLGRTRGNTS